MGIGQGGAAGKDHGALRAAADFVIRSETALEEEQVGIDLAVAGQREKTDFKAGLQCHRQETQRGFLPGTVAVEKAFHLSVIASHQHELAFGDRGTLGCDGGFEPDGPAAEGIELALDHDERFALPDGGAGAVEVKE